MKISYLLTSSALLIVAASSQAAGRLIARLAPGADPLAIAASAKVTFRDQTPDAPFVLFSVPTNEALDVAQARLRATDGVVWVEDDPGVAAPENESTSRGGTKKGSSLSVIGDRGDLLTRNLTMLSQVNFSQALADSPGRIVRVAILDTGLSHHQKALRLKTDAFYNATLIGHPDLAHFVADDVPARKDSNGNGILDEAVGHGTMVAGIIDQVDPQVHFLIAKVADSDGQATAWSLIKGLAFAVTNHAEVANISMGSPIDVPALSDVIDWAQAAGVLPVVAIGNASGSKAWFPARFTESLCVAGLDSASVKADFSNWDSRCDSSAPAIDISSQWWDGTMGVWTGTSFAAPFVSGAIADCLRRHSALPPSDIIGIVRSSGMDISSLNPDYARKLGTLLDIQALDRKFARRP